MNLVPHFKTMANLIFLTFLLLLHTCATLTAAYDFPAIIVFGDSMVDTGNNNYISTIFRANHTPYGIDFVNSSASGRFSDGSLIPDLLASALGIRDSVPPFLDPLLSDDDILAGVSFASAGSGFDNLTTGATGVIPVSEQLKMFPRYLDRVMGRVGRGTGYAILEKTLIFISAATNDFVLNYYASPSRRLQFSISEYQDFLLQGLHDLIKALYDYGGRNFLVVGVPPIGCIPLHRKKCGKQYSCSNEMNSDSMLYNLKLKYSLLQNLTGSLPGGKFSYGNIFYPTIDMLDNPAKYGLKETTRGCCGTGYIEMGPLCNLVTSHCANPSKFLFWDAIHPSQAAYRVIAKEILKDVDYLV